MRSRRGFTLVELLIGAAILVLLLSILGALLVSTRRAYQTNQAVTASSAQVRSAIEFMEYDISLAGYGGSVAFASGQPVAATPCQSQSCNSEGLEGSLLGSLTVNYVEDRFTGGPEVPVSITYSVSEGQLVRCLNPSGVCSSSTGSSVADGVVALELVNWRTSTGGPAETMPSDVSGIDLRVHYRQADGLRAEDFSVALLNAQRGGS